MKGETVRALVGHSIGDVHERSYLNLGLPVLTAAVEMLDFKQYADLPRVTLKV